MGKKIKIVFLDQTLAGGGAERVMCTVIRDLDPKKFEINLILVSEAGALYHLVPDYVKTKVLKIPNTRKALFSTVREIRKIKPEIVYTTTARIAVLALLSRIFSNSYKVIMRFPMMPKCLLDTNQLSKWKIILMKLLYQKADYVIAQTDEMKDQLINVFSIQQQKIKTIPNPIDNKYIDDCLKGQESPYDEKKINVVASGTIYPIKGFDILIKAFARVAKKDDCFRLHILGREEKDFKQELESLAGNLGVAEKIVFHGFKSNPYPYYKFCDLFVLSSRQEAQPNVLLECLSMGIPVVATKCVPVVERLVNDGKNAILVEPENIEQMKDAILNYKTIIGSKREYKRNGIVEFIEAAISP